MANGDQSDEPQEDAEDESEYGDDNSSGDEEEGEEGPTISATDARSFVKVEGQLHSFMQEIGVISKKKPDGAMNKFKLKYINQAVVTANGLLGESHRPFNDFEKFDEDDMPTASDVVTMLAQYLRSMRKFRQEFSYPDASSRRWRLSDSEEWISARSPSALSWEE